MEALFFKNEEESLVRSWEEILEIAVLGGGRFSKSNIVDMLECLNLGFERFTENLWKVTQESTKKYLSLDDEILKNAGVGWSNNESWKLADVNPMDLAGLILEIKYNANKYSLENIWVLFE